MQRSVTAFEALVRRIWSVVALCFNTGGFFYSHSSHESRRMPRALHSASNDEAHDCASIKLQPALVDPTAEARATPAP